MAAPAAPRFGAFWAMLVYAACTLALAWPAIGGRFLVNPHSDQLIAGYAFREFATQSLRAGEGFPQWNAYMFGGLPYVAAMHGDIFYPTFLLRLLLGTDLGMTWGFALHLFLAGALTFGFLRAWGLSYFPALLGGVAYMLSGQIASLVSPGHDGKLFVSALLPFVLWMLVRGIRDARAWAWGGLAAGVGLGLLSPHPQLMQYLLLTAGAFALFVAFAEHDGHSPLDRRTAITRLGFALGAVVLGVAIAAIQYLPVREYVDYSPRAGGRDYAYATSYSMPIEELFNTFLPQFTGILDAYWGRNGIHFHSEYLGAVVLLLATAAIGSGSRRSFRWFWLGTLIVSLLWAVGGSTPFYRLVYALVPGTKFFRAPSTIFYVSAFAVSVFAAVGIERVLQRGVSRRFGLLWFGGAIAGVLLLIGMSGSVAAAVGNHVAATSYGPEVRDQVVNAWVERATANRGAASLGGIRTVAFVALAVGLLWAMLSDRISRRAGAWGFVALVAVDLWTIDRRYWLWSDGAETLYASDAAIDAIRAAPQPGRVIVWPEDRVGGLVPTDPAFEGCAGGTGGGTFMVHRVRNLLGCQGNEIGRFRLLAGKTPTTNYDFARLMSPPMWRHENVHYLYTNIPDTIMTQLGAQFGTPPSLVVGPLRNGAGSTVYLYRVAGDNPLAWVAGGAVKADSAQTFGTVIDPRFDPSRAAIFEEGSSIEVTAPPAVGYITPTVQVTEYRPGHIELALSAPSAAGAALVVSENYFPGWTATADSRPIPVARANYNLIGAALPTGTRTVQLSFADPGYTTGKTVTLIACGITLLLILAGIVLERRHHPQPTPASA